MQPQTLPEWETYIKKLTGTDLFSKVCNANTQQFATLLIEEGFTMGDVYSIMEMFALQCHRAQVVVPDGVWDLKAFDFSHEDIYDDSHSVFLESLGNVEHDEFDDFDTIQDLNPL